MHRPTFVLGLALIGVTLFAGQGMANQCPALIAQIDTATAIRYDPTAADAKVQTVEIKRLHDAGQHAAAEKLGKDTLEKLK